MCVISLAGVIGIASCAMLLFTEIGLRRHLRALLLLGHLSMALYMLYTAISVINNSAGPAAYTPLIFVLKSLVAVPFCLFVFLFRRWHKERM